MDENDLDRLDRSLTIHSIMTRMANVFLAKLRNLHRSEKSDELVKDQESRLPECGHWDRDLWRFRIGQTKPLEPDRLWRSIWHERCDRVPKWY